MRKILRIAKANILRSKGAFASLFIIILIISTLISVSLTLALDSANGVREAYERMNSAHNLFIFPRADYHSSFSEIIENDPRVASFEQTEVLLASGANVEYIVSYETDIVIGYSNAPMTISAPVFIEENRDIPRDQAIYLPVIWQTVGYEIGSPFLIEHRNREIDFIVAGFFEIAELGNPEMGTTKLYVPAEGFERLTRYFGRAVWMAAILYDLEGSRQFTRDFVDQVDIDASMLGVSGGIFMLDIQFMMDVMGDLSIFIAIILMFAFILTAISMLVICFRISNSIENTMHEIGVLKAQGYTSRQVISCYIVEYIAIAFPAAFMGIAIAAFSFGAINPMLFTMSSVPFILSVNVLAGTLGALSIIAVTMLFVIISTRRIKYLPPVIALRGGIATNNFRRNFFPLNKFSGNVHSRLGLKNMLAYFKLYAMIGIVIAGATFAITSITILHQNLVADPTGLAEVAGFETHDVLVTVTRHTDAFALAQQMEQMPEVRLTTMLDFASFRINGIDTMGSQVSYDFTKLETIVAQMGRMPLYDNEIAMPRVFARELGVDIGDGVMITVAGITQEFIVTGYFSTLQSAHTSAITLEGIQRLDPDFARRTINVYLNEGTTFEEFSEILTQQFGVLNVFREREGEGFSAARARAEQRIAFYLEHFNVDSVDFAVSLDGEIIVSGTSNDFQIERITNHFEVALATVQNVAGPLTTVTQMIIIISLTISSIILSMSVRSIVAKRRSELGILKSSGYTTNQLVKQMTISFLPMTIIGIIVGCIGAAILFSPMLGAAMAAMGALNYTAVINPLIVAAIGVGVSVITCLVAHVSAMSIKKITVYELLSE